MAILARGSATVVDLHDAPVLQAVIGASKVVTQTYNNTTQKWNPDYIAAAQVLTLFVNKAGSTGNLIDTHTSQFSNIKWYKLVANTKTPVTTTTGADAVSGKANSVMTTKTNVPFENNAIRWIVEGQWTDPVSSLLVPFSASIDLTLVQLAKAALIPNVYAPDGDMFRNNTPVSLKICADLYKDGVISAGNKTYKWFASDGSIAVAQDDDGGALWRKLDKLTGTVGEVVNKTFGVETTEQGVLTVFPDAVVNAQTYKVVIEDRAGGTSGTKVTQYITLRDMDDTMVVTVEGETVIKNSAGSVTLTARVWRAGVELDTNGTLYTYKWYKFVNNVPDVAFGTNSHKLGKSLTLGGADIQGKAEFRPEVHGQKESR